MTIANIINVPITGHTGSGNIVLDTSPTLITPTVGASTATSINFGQSALSNYTTWTSFTCTLTAVGGSGNTLPTFSTETARYLRIGNIVFVAVEKFNSSGGTAGAGTGQFAASLPVTAGSNTGTLPILAGYFANNNGGGTEGIVYGTLGASATTITLTYFNAIGTTTAFTLGILNNANFRQIGLHFWYEV